MAKITHDKNIQSIIVPYSDEINECQLQLILSNSTIEAGAKLEEKLRKHIKQQKQVQDFLKRANSNLEAEINLDNQKKECFLGALEFTKYVIIENKKQLLLLKGKIQNKIEHENNNIQEYEQKWSTCKSKFECIPFIKDHFEVKNKIDAVKQDINNFKVKTKELCTNIEWKKMELFNLDKKYIVELADYMINKIPAIFTLMKQKLDNENQINQFSRINKVSAFTKLKIDAENISALNFENISKNMTDNNALVMPKLQMLTVQTAFHQNVSTHKKFKRSVETLSTIELNATSKRVKLIEANNEVNIPIYSAPPTSKQNNGNSQTKIYSNKKVIHILEDVKVDKSGTYQFISKLKPNQFKEVNIIKAGGVSQDLNKNEQMYKVKEQTDEVIEDLIEKVSQNIILPPTQFLDLTQDQESIQKDGSPTAGPLFKNYVQGVPNLEISLDTIDYEDADGEFSQCIDSMLLLSPKCDDKIQTDDKQITAQSVAEPSFLSGLKKTDFSLFRNTTAGIPKSEVPQSNEFSFTFSEVEKTKRGGFFSMFD